MFGREYKEPTTTFLVLDELRRADDFMNIRMLVERTGRTRKQVFMALHHMRKHNVVDVVVEPDGESWWFANPQEDDTRHNTVDERVPEKGPRTRKKKRGGGHE